MPEHRTDDPSPPVSLPDKRRYEKPMLEYYGNLRDITRQVGVMGMSDGGLLGILTRTQ